MKPKYEPLMRRVPNDLPQFVAKTKGTKRTKYRYFYTLKALNAAKLPKGTIIYAAAYYRPAVI